MSEQKIDEVYQLNELAGEKVLIQLRKLLEVDVESFDAKAYLELYHLYLSLR